MRPLLALALSLPLPLFACGGDDGRTTAATGATSITTSPSGTGTATATGTATDSPSSDVPTEASSAATTVDLASTSTPQGETTGVIKFDIGSAETGGTTTGAIKGCEKVDFLFVIDNSASMEDNQAALIASFPGFITAIQTTLTAASDYHIMVVDTDDDGRCKKPCDPNNADIPTFCTTADFNACTASLDECDTTRGAGVLHPVGSFASNKKCKLAEGRRYMLQSEPNLTGKFACVAKVGTAGNPSERPMNGMTEALAAPLNADGGCNAGFLRDDAILVITFISDDPNHEDEGEPQQWYDAVVAAKQGNAQSVVVAGLTLVPEDPACAGNGDTKGVHWQQFVKLWGDHGIMSTICAADYAPFFTQAVEIIHATCDNFVPPN